MFMLIFVGILVLDAAFWWWADRRARRLPYGVVWRVAIALFIGFLLAFLLSGFISTDLPRKAHLFLPGWVLGMIYIWHLMILPAWLVIAGGTGLVRLGSRAIGWWRSEEAPGEAEPARDGDEEEAPALPAPAPTPASAPGDERAWSRRQILTAAALATPPVAALGLTVIGMSRLPQLRTRHIEVAIPDLPRGLEGLSIAHVTDVHVGRYTKGAQLRRIAEATNALEADLVLHTGDLLDLAIADLPHAMEFMELLDPRGGMVICEGNHDLIGDAAAFRQRMKAAGYNLLVQEAMTVTVRDEPVQLMGLQWTRGEELIGRTVQNIARLRNPEAFPILLAHHPHAFDHAVAAGIPLTLSGHTHGGQLMLNEDVGFGPLMFRYWTGLYEKAGASLVVSNGAGNWFPLRTAAPAEVVQVTLRRMA